MPSGRSVVPPKFGVSAVHPLQSGVDTSVRVLTFSGATQDYDTFSAPFDLSAYKTNGQTVTLSFDFLSAATNDHPGLVGFRFQVPTSANPADPGGAGPNFIAGAPTAQASVGLSTLFSGTGVWQHVTVPLADYIANQTAPQLATTYIFFEKWTGDAGQVSSANVYLDNLVVSAVPAPAAFGIITGLVSLFVVWRRMGKLGGRREII